MALNALNWDHEDVRVQYRNKLRMLLSNCMSSTDLINDISTGRIPVKDVCYLSHMDLKPDRWPRPKKLLREEHQRQGTLECSNCRFRGLPSFNTEFRESQTRSADESTTIFAVCFGCGKRWKM
jgi:hypothetical protein